MAIYPTGTRIANRYEVVQGPRENPGLAGGMGIVYLCLDHQEDRPVALKTFKPKFLSHRAARDRFLREGTTWVNLGRHPHVVCCYRVIQPGVSPEVYLVLELVTKEDGRNDASLRSWLTSGKPLSMEQALLFGLQIARGMRHATAVIKGFVHRDLKPENVLIGADHLSSAKINRLRVTDFGLVAVLEDTDVQVAEGIENKRISGLERTQLTRGEVGTPRYMAPEQWTGEGVCLQTDVYALGCILYEMITGHQVVEGQSDAALKRAHCEGKLLPLPTGLPTAVGKVVERCLAFEPGMRYASWEKVEKVLTATYTEIVGQTAPGPEPMETLERADRVAAGWSYTVIGFSYLDIGKAEVALEYLKRARDVGRAEKEQGLEAAGLTTLGGCYANLGKLRQAIGFHEQALTIYREIGDWHGEGTALNNLGVTYVDLGNARRAIECYRQAQTIARETNDQRGEGNALTNLGNAYVMTGRAQQAIECYEQAIAIAHEIGDQRGEENALGGLGNVYRMLGDARQAIGFFERAMIIARGIGDRRGEGLSLGNIGTAYVTLGDVRKAIGFFEQDLTIAREIGSRIGEGRSLTNLGVAHAHLGDVRKAIGFFEQSLVVMREIGNRREEANALGNLAHAYDDLGDSPRAVQFYEQSLAIAQEIKDTMAAANTSFNFALLLTKQSRWADALHHAEFAAGVFAQVKHKPMLQKVQQLLGTLRAIQSDPTDAKAYYDRGNVCASLGRNDEALADFTQAIQLDPSYAPAYLNIGILLTNRGRLQEALPHFEKAAQLGIPAGAQHAARVRQRLAGLSASQANPAQLAFEAFQGTDSLNGMRHTVAQFPFMTDPDFIAAVERAIAQQVPKNLKAAFEQRLTWLYQIADKQKQ
jgi:tetratricopeptide (TPR) repeat protein